MPVHTIIALTYLCNIQRWIAYCPSALKANKTNQAAFHLPPVWEERQETNSHTVKRRILHLRLKSVSLRFKCKGVSKYCSCITSFNGHKHHIRLQYSVERTVLNYLCWLYILLRDNNLNRWEPPTLMEHQAFMFLHDEQLSW